jgi:hypothetical protein
MQNGGTVSAANALMLTSLFLGFNMAEVICVINIVAQKMLINGFLLYAMLVMPMIFVWIFSMRRRQYIQHNMLFKNESKVQMIIGNSLTFIYSVGTIWLLIFLITMLRRDVLKIY